MTGPTIAQFLVLLAFWFALSGRFGPLFVVMGVVSAALVTALTRAAVAEVLGPSLGGARTIVRRAWRFVVYVVWLLGRIPPAAWQIVTVVAQPSLPVRPHVIEFTTRLESPVARTMLANSISLVPGTITLAVDGPRFAVHAFLPASADDLVTAALQNRIADVFLADHEPPPQVTWTPATDGATDLGAGATS